MPQPLSGPGVGLPYAQYLYPSQLTNAPVDFNSNRLALAPGEAIALPAGDWYVDPGMYCVVQFLDPTNGEWTTGVTGGWSGGLAFVKSDGFNARVANMTACPVSAIVTGAGSGFTQSTATITPSAGTSTWEPIIGGALSIVSIAVAGSGYGIPPLVLIPAPAPASSNPNGVGGKAATAYAILTGGSVSAVSWINQGAGYNVVPPVTIVPDPYDPNLSSTTPIVGAVVSIGLTGAGTLTGAICTDSGIALTNSQIAAGLTLTAAGGSGATLSAVVMQTVVGLTSIGTAGAGYANALLTTVGGVPAAGANVTPSTTNKAFRPRPAQAVPGLTGTSISSLTLTIYDGGLFEGTPTAVIVGGAVTSAAVVTLTMGGAVDHVILQPAP